MRKNRFAAGALTLAVSMTICGCSQKMYDLTDTEEAAVINYAARAVTKFNLRQTEGIRNVAVLEKKMADEKELEEQKKEEEKRQQEEEKNQQKPADQKPSENTGATQQEQVNYVSLNQALKLGGVDAVCRSCEKTTAYNTTDSFLVTANDGNELLILHIDLKNNSGKKAGCDILSKMPSFRLTVNDTVSMSADTTLLLNDFGTYQGDIQAGSTQKTVLVFQARKGTLKKIKNMVLEVNINGTASQVLLVRN